jgi:hypothetical protein
MFGWSLDRADRLHKGRCYGHYFRVLRSGGSWVRPAIIGPAAVAAEHLRDRRLLTLGPARNALAAGEAGPVLIVAHSTSTRIARMRVKNLDFLLMKR